jgi:putative aldouronate transport system permease protein
MKRKNDTAIHDSRSDKITRGVFYVLLTLFAIVCAYPIYFVLIASVSDPSRVLAGKVVLLPDGWNLKGFEKVFADNNIWTAYGNTIFYTFFGTVLNIVMTMTAAYVLSCKDFLGKGFFMKLVTFTMFFSGGLIPTYITYRSLGILDTKWVMILPGLISPFNMIIARTFIKSNISEQLYEAAELDGSSHFRYYLQIVIPLSTTIIAVLTLYYAVGHWNSYYNALMYLNNQAKWPLQMVLRKTLIQNSFSASDLMIEGDDAAELQYLGEQIKYALIIVATVPILCIYPFLQKYFVKGVMIGSIKG